MDINTKRPNLAFILIGILVATFPLAFSIILKYMVLTNLDKSTDLYGIIIYYTVFILSILSSLGYYLVSVLSITAYLIWCVSREDKD